LLGFVSPSLAEEEAILNLEEILEEAIKKNPQIKAARERWRAAKEKVPQARSLPDPIFGYTYFGESIETRNGPQRSIYHLSQKFPFFGKLRLRGEVATMGAKVAEEEYRATEREIITQVKKTYYELYWIHKAIEVTEEIKELLEEFEEIAKIRYATGKGPQQNLLRAQVEISKLMDKLLVLEQMKTTIVARLNTLMDRPPGTPLGRPEDFELSKFPYKLDELYLLGKKYRQEVRAANFAVGKAEAAHKLAKKEYLPDFIAGFKYIEIGPGTQMSPDSGQDAWMATLTINLPIWRGRLRAVVDEAKANIIASNNKLQDMQNMTFFQIKDAYSRLMTTKDLIEIYQDALIPQAEQSLKATKTGYETGRATFLDLLDSQRSLLQIKIGFYRVVADYMKNLADLERAVGIDLRD
jgi:outer membrane protein TolC